VQVKRGLLPIACCAALCAASAKPCAAVATPDEATFSSLFRLFTDSGHISVRSLTGDYAVPFQGTSALSLHWNNETVTIPAIHAPAGSQEAVDAITTASRPIAGNAYQDYIKVRNEIQGDLTRGNAGVEYYVSSESDYLAQQFGANYNHDSQDQLLNVSVGTSFGYDAIQPLANDRSQAAADHKRTLHWNAIATRILSPTTMLRLGVKYNIVDGLQHNPYRNVYAGGTQVPERHPSHRERRDTFLRLNQYLPNRSSLKLNYRFYNDDWGIWSHEIGSSLDQYISHDLSASYEYRYYTQTPADFYRTEYASVDGIDGYRSGDYRLNNLASHLFGFSVHMDLNALAADHPLLGRTAIWLDYQRYFNSNNYSANILETGLDFRFQ